jgi:hypothetical protein
MSLVLEVTLFSSLKVLREFVELEKSSTDSDSLPELNNWARALTAGHIDRGDLSTGGKQDFDKILSTNTCRSLLDCSLSGRIHSCNNRPTKIRRHEIFAQNIAARTHATDHLLEFTSW